MGHLTWCQHAIRQPCARSNQDYIIFYAARDSAWLSTSKHIYIANDCLSRCLKRWGPGLASDLFESTDSLKAGAASLHRGSEGIGNCTETEKIKVAPPKPTPQDATPRQERKMERYLPTIY